MLDNHHVSYVQGSLWVTLALSPKQLRFEHQHLSTKPPIFPQLHPSIKQLPPRTQGSSFKLPSSLKPHKSPPRPKYSSSGSFKQKTDHSSHHVCRTIFNTGQEGQSCQVRSCSLNFLASEANIPSVTHLAARRKMYVYSASLLAPYEDTVLTITRSTRWLLPFSRRRRSQTR